MIQRKKIVLALAFLAAAFGFAYWNQEFQTVDSMEAESVLIPAVASRSVYESMEQLASVGSFTFKAVRYPALGYFVNEINGRENKNGYYWTLYIDGKYSNKGASSVILQGDELIQWRYEKK